MEGDSFGGINNPPWKYGKNGWFLMVPNPFLSKPFGINKDSKKFLFC